MRWLQKLFGKSAPAASAPATPAMKSAPPGLAVNWPYPLITVRGAEAPALLAEMATASAGRSWPVLLGAPDELDMLSQDMSPDVSTEQILADASTLGDGVREGLKKLYAEEMGEDAEDIEPGDWPAQMSGPQVMQCHLNQTTHRPMAKALITTLPTPHPYESPAYLRYGNWNACPPAHYHVAIHRRWEESFGARIVAMTHDVIECRVQRRPRDRAEAMALAWEQYYYAPDIVEQGTETISRLAAILLVSNFWYFWWD